MIATFIDEKDAADVPELVLGQRYIARNKDQEFVDIYTIFSNKYIGTYCVGRFAFQNEVNS